MPTVRAQINPKMLRFARERSGVRIEEAAKWANVPEAKYRNWETELEKAPKELPTIRKLQALGAKFKRPLVFFFLERPPRNEIDPEDFRDFRIVEGGGANLTRWLRHALRLAAERRAVALDLSMDAVEVDISPFTLSCTLDEDPNVVGARVRELLGVEITEQKRLKGSSDYPYWKRLVSSAGVLVFEFSRVDVHEARGFAIGLRPFPVIGVNGADASAARLFTLLHELVHIMLGEQSVISDPDYRDGVEEERFCNAVAAAALVPKDELLREPEVLSASEETTWPDNALIPLARRYGVSRHAMLRRLIDLGKTNQTYYWRRHKSFLDEYLQIKKEQKERAKDSPPRLPLPRRSLKANGQLFAQVVLGAYAADQLTLAKASRLLRIRPEQMKDMQFELLRAQG